MYLGRQVPMYLSNYLPTHLPTHLLSAGGRAWQTSTEHVSRVSSEKRFERMEDKVDTPLECHLN